MQQMEIILFETQDIKLEVPVSPEQDTVWLNRQQMAQLFDRDIKTIGKHIANAYKEELNDQVVDAAFVLPAQVSPPKSPTVAKFATVQKEGNRTITRQIEYYNLDVILSVGYRVKSKQGVLFRKWANAVLKNYILKGVAINQHRLKQLQQVIKILKRSDNLLETNQALSVIESYSNALALLDAYDHQTLQRPVGNPTIHRLTYEECRAVIDSMSFGAASSLFGNEKDDSFKGSIGNIYQSFGGLDIYPTLEEKAAHLLYFITKNHSFSDGNKRIAATIFLHFLNKNKALFTDGEKLIDDHTLFALTIMVAESHRDEKETMISVILNCITREK